LIKISILKN